MLYDTAWQARISRVLSGALRAWDISGSVRIVPGPPRAFVISSAGGTQLRIVHRVPGGWAVFLHDSASACDALLSDHAGLPGLLRRLREELAPHAASGRLVIGRQSLL